MIKAIYDFNFVVAVRRLILVVVRSSGVTFNKFLQV